MSKSVPTRRSVRAPSLKRGPRPELSSRSRTPGWGGAPRRLHLSYLGDADVGEGANIGAGTITANYDGYDKHRTNIGAGAQIGSNTVLVAPVEVGEEGWTGAGSTITRPVESGALSVERSQQRNIAGYAARRAARYRQGKEKDPSPSAPADPASDS